MFTNKTQENRFSMCFHVPRFAGTLSLRPPTSLGFDPRTVIPTRVPLLEGFPQPRFTPLEHEVLDACPKSIPSFASMAGLKRLTFWVASNQPGQNTYGLSVLTWQRHFVGPPHDTRQYHPPKRPLVNSLVGSTNFTPILPPINMTATSRNLKDSSRVAGRIEMKHNQTTRICILRTCVDIYMRKFIMPNNNTKQNAKYVLRACANGINTHFSQNVLILDVASAHVKNTNTLCKNKTAKSKKRTIAR